MHIRSLLFTYVRLKLGEVTTRRLAFLPSHRANTYLSNAAANTVRTVYRGACFRGHGRPTQRVHARTHYTYTLHTVPTYVLLKYARATVDLTTAAAFRARAARERVCAYICVYKCACVRMMRFFFSHPIFRLGTSSDVFQTPNFRLVSDIWVYVMNKFADKTLNSSLDNFPNVVLARKYQSSVYFKLDENKNVFRQTNHAKFYNSMRNRVQK